LQKLGYPIKIKDQRMEVLKQLKDVI